MNELIESGDPRAKVVGKPRPPQVGAQGIIALGRLNALGIRLRRRKYRVKRGVYRFISHQAADEWMMNLFLS
jgi:hypothetical protein